MRPAPLRANRARRLGAGDGFLKKEAPHLAVLAGHGGIGVKTGWKHSRNGSPRGWTIKLPPAKRGKNRCCRTTAATRRSLKRSGQTSTTSAEPSLPSRRGPARGRRRVAFSFLQTGQIRESWAAARDKAMRHEDAEKLLIENIKLDTLREIESQFSNIEERTR